MTSLLGEVLSGPAGYLCVRACRLCVGGRRVETCAAYVHVHGIHSVGVTAAAVLETVRTKARSCQKYVRTTNKPEREVKADIALPELTGVDDSYGLCQSIPDVSDGGFWSCEAFVTHGDLLVAVEVIVGTAAEVSASPFPQVLPRVVTGLLKAG